MIAQPLVLALIVPFHDQPMPLAVTAFMGATLVAGSILIIAADRRACAIIVARQGEPA